MNVLKRVRCISVPRYPLNAYITVSTANGGFSTIHRAELHMGKVYDVVRETSQQYWIDVTTKDLTTVPEEDHWRHKRYTRISKTRFEEVKVIMEMKDKLRNNCVTLSDTLVEKNRKYKNSFIDTMDKYGDSTILIRLDDKMKRLEAFLLDGEPPLEDEGLEDTLLDIAGYAILARVYYQDKRRKSELAGKVIEVK